MAKTITAQKGNRTREFSQITWDLLGTNKGGWEQVKTAKAPKETKEATKTPTDNGNAV